jgi:hypothetical protein
MADWRERADYNWQDKSTKKGARYYEGEPEVIPPKADPVFDYAVKQCEKSWREDREAGSVMWMLRLAVTLHGNYDKVADHTPSHAERLDWLKGRVGALVRDADPAEVLGEPRVRELVMTFYGEAGINRLIERTKAQRLAA